MVEPPADLSHLHEAVRSSVMLPACERIAAIRSDRWIGYPRALAAIARLEALLSWPARQRMPNMLLIGPTNNGKSMIIERFRRAHPQIGEPDRERIPVLCVQMPSDPSPLRFYTALRAALGAPLRPRPRLVEIEQLTLETMRRVGVKVLVIDELHNAMAGRGESRREFLNLLRFIGNELRIPLVGVGTREAYLAVRSDEQLENRFEPFTLPTWLARLAAANLTSVADLLRHDLGFPRDAATGRGIDLLDLAAPGVLLRRLSARTGVAVDEIRAMTIEGWVPWLTDSLNGEPAPGVAFDTYLDHGTVLFADRKNPTPGVDGWRAWLPYRPEHPGRLMARACPACVAADRDDPPIVPLILMVPVTVTCPRHRCRLQAVRDRRDLPVVFDDPPEPESEPVPPAVLEMDARTYQGMSDGIVGMPRRAVHVGVWLRLLRTLIEELGESPSSLTARDRRTLHAIWQEAGDRSRRSGLYEDLEWESQRALLEAAAAALAMARDGRIEAHGTLAPLLTPQPVSPFSPYAPDPAHGVEVMIHRMTRDARTDPELARELLSHMTGPDPIQAAYHDSRRILANRGIPGDFLPQTAPEL